MATPTQEIRKFVKDLEGVFKDITSKRQLLFLGNEAIKVIKDRTRRGRGVAKPGGRSTKLKALSKAYIEQRKRIRLSPFTNARKSNLTRSGRMLASLRSTVQGNKVVVKPTGQSREGVPNEKVAEHVTDQGRPFLNLSADETQRLLKQFRIALERGLKRLD